MPRIADPEDDGDNTIRIRKPFASADQKFAAGPSQRSHGGRAAFADSDDELSLSRDTLRRKPLNKVKEADKPGNRPETSTSTSTSSSFPSQGTGSSSRSNVADSSSSSFSQDSSVMPSPPSGNIYLAYKSTVSFISSIPFIAGIVFFSIFSAVSTGCQGAVEVILWVFTFLLNLVRTFLLGKKKGSAVAAASKTGKLKESSHKKEKGKKDKAGKAISKEAAANVAHPAERMPSLSRVASTSISQRGLLAGKHRDSLESHNSVNHSTLCTHNSCRRVHKLKHGKMQHHKDKTKHSTEDPNNSTDLTTSCGPGDGQRLSVPVLQSGSCSCASSANSSPSLSPRSNANKLLSRRSSRGSRSMGETTTMGGLQKLDGDAATNMGTDDQSTTTSSSCTASDDDDETTQFRRDRHLRIRLNKYLQHKTPLYTNDTSMNISVCTWNVAQKLPGNVDDLADWLLGGGDASGYTSTETEDSDQPSRRPLPDILAVGLQEAEFGGTALMLEVTEAKVAWQEAITECLNRAAFTQQETLREEVLAKRRALVSQRNAWFASQLQKVLHWLKEWERKHAVGGEFTKGGLDDSAQSENSNMMVSSPTFFTPTSAHSLDFASAQSSPRMQPTAASTRSRLVRIGGGIRNAAPSPSLNPSSSSPVVGGNITTAVGSSAVPLGKKKGALGLGNWIDPEDDGNLNLSASQRSSKAFLAYLPTDALRAALVAGDTSDAPTASTVTEDLQSLKAALKRALSPTQMSSPLTLLDAGQMAAILIGYEAIFSQIDTLHHPDGSGCRPGDFESCFPEALGSSSLDSPDEEFVRALVPRFRYKKVQSVQLVGLVLLLVVRSDHISALTNIQSAVSRTGAIKGVMGNKGTVGLRFSFYGKRILLLCAHFDANAKNKEKRNKDYVDAMTAIRFPIDPNQDDEVDTVVSALHRQTTQPIGTPFKNGRRRPQPTTASFLSDDPALRTFAPNGSTSPELANCSAQQSSQRRNQAMAVAFSRFRVRPLHTVEGSAGRSAQVRGASTWERIFKRKEKNDAITPSSPGGAGILTQLAASFSTNLRNSFASLGETKSLQSEGNDVQATAGARGSVATPTQEVIDLPSPNKAEEEDKLDATASPVKDPLAPPPSSAAKQFKSPHFTTHDYIFFFGDLNYRLGAGQGKKGKLRHQAGEGARKLSLALRSGGHRTTQFISKQAKSIFESPSKATFDTLFGGSSTGELVEDSSPLEGILEEVASGGDSPQLDGSISPSTSGGGGPTFSPAVLSMPTFVAQSPSASGPPSVTAPPSLLSPSTAAFSASTSSVPFLPPQYIKTLIYEKAFDTLLEYDQLRTAMTSGAAFTEFSEMPIKFPPTYKFDLGTKTYDTSHKKRDPAWTDRVLFWTKGEPNVGNDDSPAPSVAADSQDTKSTVSNHITPCAYQAAQNLLISDHRPVAAHFTISVSKIDADSAGMVLEDLLEGKYGTRIQATSKKRAGNSSDDDDEGVFN